MQHHEKMLSTIKEKKRLLQESPFNKSHPIGIDALLFSGSPLTVSWHLMKSFNQNILQPKIQTSPFQPIMIQGTVIKLNVETTNIIINVKNINNKIKFYLQLAIKITKFCKSLEWKKNKIFRHVSLLLERDFK